MQADLSITSLFFQADLLVKIVLFLLLFASVLSWKIIFTKILALKTHIKQCQELEGTFESCQNAQALTNQLDNLKGVIPEIFSSTLQKFNFHNKKSSALDYLESKCGKVVFSLEKNLDILATIASTSPFIGLFGTVWGIMRSFQTIGALSSPTLAVVAPSIAEALLATAAGLFAAIPALIFYNHIAVKISSLAKRLEQFASELKILFDKSESENN